jgi:hypothetical protein
MVIRPAKQLFEKSFGRVEPNTHEKKPAGTRRLQSRHHGGQFCETQAEEIPDGKTGRRFPL